MHPKATRVFWIFLIGICAVCGLVALAAFGSSAYQLAFGDRIPAQVISCSGPVRRATCEVSWTDGAQHGISSVDDLNDSPGQTITVFHMPGHSGVGASEQAAVVTVIVVPLVFIGVALAVVQGRRRSKFAAA